MQRPEGLNYKASLRAALGDTDEARVAALANRQERTIDALLARMYGPDASRREITLLADEVGLGKTFVALGVAWSVLMQRQAAGLAAGPVLVLSRRTRTRSTTSGVARRSVSTVWSHLPTAGSRSFLSRRRTSWGMPSARGSPCW